MKMRMRVVLRQCACYSNGSVEGLVEFIVDYVLVSGVLVNNLTIFSATLTLSSIEERRAVARAVAQRLVDIEARAGVVVSLDMMMAVVQGERVEEQLVDLLDLARRGLYAILRAQVLKGDPGRG